MATTPSGSAGGPSSSVAVLAHVIGCSHAEVARLASEGVIPKPLERGQYDTVECLRAYITHLRQDLDTVDAKTLAEYLGVSKFAVHKMQRENGMPRIRPGKYSLRACIAWNIDRFRRLAKGEGNSELSEERRLLLVEQRRRARVEADLAEKEQVPRAECEDGWRMLAGLFVAQLEALPGRIAGEVVDVSSPNQAREIILAETRRSRQHVSDELSRLATRLRRAGRGDHKPATR